jgi:hypothetical protein
MKRNADALMVAVDHAIGMRIEHQAAVALDADDMTGGEPLAILERAGFELDWLAGSGPAQEQELQQQPQRRSDSAKL